MNRYEKDEIRSLPDKYKPLGAWAYFGYQILFSIPLVGFICLLIFSFSDSNINRRSFARSYFCGLIIALIFIGALIALGMGGTLWAALMEVLQGAGGQ